MVLEFLPNRCAPHRLIGLPHIDEAVWGTSILRLFYKGIASHCKDTKLCLKS